MGVRDGLEILEVSYIKIGLCLVFVYWGMYMGGRVWREWIRVVWGIVWID